MIFILGASGYIGSHLFTRLEINDKQVMGTCCKNPSKGLVPFDLSSDVFPPPGVDIDRITHLVITAASTTKIDQVKERYEYYHSIDVGRLCDILKTCRSNNIVPTYISTDFVFDGEKGGYAEQDLTGPLNGYGRIKEEVENFIVDHFSNFMIIRVGKVFDIKPDGGTMITDMIRDLKQGKILACSDDQVFTPVEIEDLVSFIELGIDRNLSGIFHAASTKALTRYDIGATVVRSYGLDESLILSCRINDLGLPEKRPLKIDMDVSKYLTVADRQLVSLEKILAKMKNNGV